MEANIARHRLWPKNCQVSAFTPLLYHVRVFCYEPFVNLSMSYQMLCKKEWTKYEDLKLCLKLYPKESVCEGKERRMSNK